MRRSLLFTALFLAACGHDLANPSEVDGEDLSTGESEVAGELKAAVSKLTVWIRPTMTAETRDGRLVYVARGRASQNLDQINTFVPDDVCCQGQVLTARTFEIVCDSNSELNTIASGLRLFMGIWPASSAVPAAVAAISFGPVFSAPSGTTSISAQPALIPTAQGDSLRYRAIVKTLNGEQLGSSSGTVSRRSATEFNVDMSFEEMRAASDSLSDNVTFTINPASGTKVKRVTLAVGVKGIELNRGDAYELWPSLSCTPAVQSCLDAMPAGAIDSEACGTWYPVMRCQVPWRGVQLFNTPDDVSALTTAVSTIQAQLPSYKWVAFRGYGTPDVMRNADFPKVLSGWKSREPYGDLVDVGDLTATALRNELRAFGNAESLITATQQTVLQQSFVARKFQRSNGTIALYVIFSATAARVTVLETGSLQP